MTLRQARKICNGIIEDQFPGYYLMADSIDRGAYVSFWGLDDHRVEVVFCRDLAKDNNAYIARYRPI